MGIEDMHATIEWHGSDCKIHSKAKESPGRRKATPPRICMDLLRVGGWLM